MDSILLSREAPRPDMAALVDQYGDALLRICFLYLKDSYLAEDALQDTFLKVYQHYGKFKGEASEKTWVTRIAINTCKNYLRTMRRCPTDDLVAFESIPANPHAHPLEDNTLAVEVMKLPPKYKEVILLFYYQQFKIHEIAGILKTPAGTIASRLKKARALLETNLKGWYYDE